MSQTTYSQNISLLGYYHYPNLIQGDLVRRILVAEPDHTLLEGIKSILATMPDAVVCGEATNRHHIFANLRTNPADLILLEPLMGGATGESLIRQLRMVAPSVPILALTYLNEARFGIKSMEAGASGFLHKDCTKEELLYATRRTLSRKRYISPELAEQILSGGRDAGRALPHQILSEREMDVCLRLAGGERVSSIGSSLNLSAKTVSTHKTRSFKKLQIQTLQELVISFTAHGYLRVDGAQQDEALSA